MTTNIEDYIFMEIKNVSVTNDPQVKFNGSDSPVLYSSENNGENDRAAIDLGYVTVINLYVVLLFSLLRFSNISESQQMSLLIIVVQFKVIPSFYSSKKSLQ